MKNCLCKALVMKTFQLHDENMKQLMPFIGFTIMIHGAFDMNMIGAYDNFLTGQLAQLKIRPHRM